VPETWDDPSRLGVTLSAGNRVASNSEIWLYPDGSLHEYLDAATLETIDGGYTQRTYVGPAQEDRITIDDLEEQIAFHSDHHWEDDSDPELSLTNSGVLAFHLYIRPIDAIALVGRLQMRPTAFVQLKCIRLHPTPNATGIHLHTTFSQQLRDMFIRQRISEIPAHA
jgi:hypothetical protein